LEGETRRLRRAGGDEGRRPCWAGGDEGRRPRWGGRDEGRRQGAEDDCKRRKQQCAQRRGRARHSQANTHWRREEAGVMIRTADCLQNPLEPCGTPWILRETSGTPWNPMEPPRALQNLTEAYGTVQKVTEPYRSAWNIPPGSIRFHYLPSPSMSFPHGTL
jgi:hypothetical protein